MRSFTVDPDIRHAETPPGWVYSDAEVFARAKEAIFARSWQLVGDLDRIKVPGSVLPVTFLDGLLPEPLLLTRDDQDRVHCLSNVCTHRANLVVEGEAVLPALRCRYHGRRFGLDGRFLSMPEFDDAVGFPRANEGLPSVETGAWGPFLFAALAPATPFARWIDPLVARVDGYDAAAAVFDAARSRDYLVNANWALYVDNYLEGFHVPFVHTSLNDAIDYGSYRVEPLPDGVLQVAYAKGGEAAFAPPAGAPADAPRVAAYYVWLWPNTMFNLYPWGVSVNVVRPLAVDRTKVSFLTFVSDPARLDQGAGAGLDRVEREDEAVVESVQRGVAARLYGRGRYSPRREPGVHAFHRLLAAALSGPEG